MAPPNPGATATFLADMASRLMSPYQLNPFNLNPLEGLLSAEVDFEALRASPPLRLLIAATSVSNGRLRIFRETELTREMVLASACLPLLSQAVQIGGERYWDGGIVVIFVIFILLQREDLRNRLIRLAGAHDLQKTTAALDDAGARLSRLFLIQLGVNAALDRSFGDRRRHAQWLQSSDRLSQRDGTARRRCGVEIPDQGPLGRGDRVPLSAGLSGHWSGCNCGSVQGSRQCDRRHGWLHVQDRRAPDLDAGQGAS